LSSLRVFIDKKAQKQLDILPKGIQDKVACAIRTLRKEGFYGNLDIKRLNGSPDNFRIRVGTYRILFELSAVDTVEIHAIMLRKNAYK